MKRIATVQDISCIGKCSLTVALPILSVMGVETAALPTAVLSAHTAFSEYTFHDLTEELPHIAAHWKHEKLTFDAVYTGYLGSEEQLDFVLRFLDDTVPSLVFVDPVLGDHGRLYAGFTPQFVTLMAEKLCARADILVPNVTEARFLTGMEERDPADKGYCRELLYRLCALGTKKAVLTGVRKGSEIGVMSYNAQTDDFFSYYGPHVDRVFHGTGDIFASCCVGALMREKKLEEALMLAVSFVSECIRKTVADADAPWYGVNFEEALPMLVRGMQ